MNPFAGLDLTAMIFIILQVIILDGILSLDNAAVLGAMASKLPEHQQKIALRVGILGAYIGRGLMLFAVGIIIAIPLLKVFGALYLLNLVFGHFDVWGRINKYTGIFTLLGKLLFPIKWLFNKIGFKISLGGFLNKFIKSEFVRVVIAIEIMDLVFSLDNVIALVALTDHLWIIILGVCIAIVIMRFASVLFLKLIKFEPLLEHAAYVLILAIAIELIFKYFHVEIGELVQFGISMSILIGFVLYGQIGRRLGWIESKEEELEETHLDEELKFVEDFQDDGELNRSVR